jgi:hypothetical protein
VPDVLVQLAQDGAGGGARVQARQHPARHGQDPRAEHVHALALRPRVPALDEPLEDPVHGGLGQLRPLGDAAQPAPAAGLVRAERVQHAECLLRRVHDDPVPPGRTGYR